MACPRLQALDLGWCRDFHVEPVVEALAAHSRDLRKLFLTAKRCADAGAGAGTSSLFFFVCLPSISPYPDGTGACVGSDVSEASLARIARCTRLEQLDLLGCSGATPAAVAALCAAAPALRLLDVSFCGPLTLAAVERLRAQFPHVAIKRSFS